MTIERNCFVIVCDRCGAKGYGRIEGEAMKRYEKDPEGWKRSVNLISGFADLCPECAKELGEMTRKWFKEAERK